MHQTDLCNSAFAESNLISSAIFGLISKVIRKNQSVKYHTKCLFLTWVILGIHHCRRKALEILDNWGHL